MSGDQHGDTLYFKGVKQQRWHDLPDWVPTGEVPADCLNDLQTSSNELSVFLIPAERADELTQRLAAALVAKKNALSHYDYALLSPEAIADIPIRTEVTLG
jgi:hypothetical protein